MAAKNSGFKYTPSLVIGLLLVPLSAVAAFALVSNQSSQGESGPAEEAPATTAVVVSAPSEVVATTTTSPEVDLAAACGKDGLSLVAAEAGDTITDLERAALDALRPICKEAGRELPGPPAPAPVVRTVTVSSGGGTSAPGADNGSNRGHEDDDHEDRDDEGRDSDDHGEEDDEDEEDD